MHTINTNLIKSAQVKVGSNKGNSRIWIEGKNLISAGFYSGHKYDIAYNEKSGKIILQLDIQGKKKVSGKKDGTHPIIDIANKKLTAFASAHFGEKVTVNYSLSTITIEA